MNIPPDLPKALQEKLIEIDHDSKSAIGFTQRDWLLLLLTGVALPLVLIWWGAA